MCSYWTARVRFWDLLKIEGGLDAIRNILHAGLVVSFVLCFSTDGFNPWKGSPYTIWFLCVKILNYKPNPGSKTSNLIVIGLVSGPRAPKQFHWYTQMVKEELDLLEKGVLSIHPYDSDRQAWVYADLILFSADHPGYGELLNVQYAGAKWACKLCTIQGTKHCGVRCFSYEGTRRDLGFTGQDEAIRKDSVYGPEELRGPIELRTGQMMYDDMMKAHTTQIYQRGHKGYSPFTAKYYERLVGMIACDICHNMKVTFKHVCRPLKGKMKTSAFKKPQHSKKIRDKYAGKEQEIPEREKTKLRIRTEAWEKRVAAQQQVLQNAKELVQSEKNQGEIDIRYMWCAGPGDFAGTGLPMRWTGSFNIHQCQIWWTSEICLYVLYPYVPEDFFDMLVSLCEVYRLCCDYDPDIEHMKKIRPEVIRGLCKFEKYMPKTEIGILFHEIKHCFDFIPNAGPSYTYWMYIFERLVSQLIRMIHDKAHPEANLANEKAFKIGLDNLVRCQQDTIGEYADSAEDKTTRKVFEKLDLLQPCRVDDSPVSSYVLPVRISGAKHLSFEGFRRTHSNFPGFADIAVETLVDGVPTYPEIFLLKSTWEITVNGALRRTIAAEPPIGTRFSTRRHSGFLLEDSQNHRSSSNSTRVGQIRDFYLVRNGKSRKLFVDVDIYTKYIDPVSKVFWLINVNEPTRMLIEAEALGLVYVFAPWTGKGRVDEINLTTQCVLKTKQRLQ